MYLSFNRYYLIALEKRKAFIFLQAAVPLPALALMCSSNVCPSVENKNKTKMQVAHLDSVCISLISSTPFSCSFGYWYSFCDLPVIIMVYFSLGLLKVVSMLFYCTEVWIVKSQIYNYFPRRLSELHLVIATEGERLVLSVWPFFIWI